MASKSIITTALATIVAAALPASAVAQHGYGDDHAGYNRGGDQRDWQDDRGYDLQGAYGRADYAPVNYRYRCKGNGTTGTVVGGLAGALLGNGIAGHGDRLLGTLLGGGVGALAGRAIDRSNSRC